MSDKPDTIRDLALSTGDSGAEQLRVSWSRKILALLIAIAVDAPPLCLLGESIPVLFDVAVAAALWLVLGRSRLLAVALLNCARIMGLGTVSTLEGTAIN